MIEEIESRAASEWGGTSSGVARPDLSADYFELFGQPRIFAIDVELLAGRYRALQSATHPDRFASGTPAERRWSVQASSFVNDAYESLRKPLKRAVYLLGLAGVTIDEETDTRMDPMFLMQQMEWREALEAAPTAADPEAALDALSGDFLRAQKDAASEFASMSEREDWDGARDVVRRWQFLDKISREANETAARLEDQ